MEYVIGLLVCGICGAAGFLTALIASAAAVSRGPKRQRIVACLCGFACAVVMGLLFVRAGGTVFGLLSGVACMGGAILCAVLFSKPAVTGIDYLPNEPELVREHGLANFDALDSDGDGVVKLTDLSPGTLAGLDAEAEKAILAHMRKHIGEIGQWVGSSAREHDVSAEESGRSDARRVLTVHSGVFGISRDDLRSYPRRARKLFAKNAKPAGKASAG